MSGRRAGRRSDAHTAPQATLATRDTSDKNTRPVARFHTPAQGDFLPAEVAYDPEARSSFSLLDEMIVGPGTYDDWLALHHLHYRGEGRPLGARYYSLKLRGDTVGVVALTIPKPLLKQRHAVFPKLAPSVGESKNSNTWRYKWINDNIRVIGRIVLDTQFRGVGASYRFQNLVSRMSNFRIIEIQSAMSKYNLFGQRAGFTFVKPMRSNKYENGLRFFRTTFESHPADTVGLLDELRAMKPHARKHTLERAMDFYRKNSAMEKTGNNRFRIDKRLGRMDEAELIRQLQQLVLASPLYGFYRNPDFGRDDIPAELPLTAFDRQPTNQPLILP